MCLAVGFDLKPKAEDQAVRYTVGETFVRHCPDDDALTACMEADFFKRFVRIENFSDLIKKTTKITRKDFNPTSEIYNLLNANFFIVPAC